jgi:4-diphosphocytidyl-2-C-methyl-D-erythritol kinase
VIRLLAFAKLNLTLLVRGRRPDGYHEIDSLVQTVDLADRVFVARTRRGIRVENDLVDLRGRDLAEVAAERVLRAKGANCGLSIGIEKGIPAGAGLGGGSSDAAAVLAAADRLVSPPLLDGDLARVASEVGSDVPLFLHGGLLRVTGRGERVAAAGEPSCERFVLLVPPIQCDTGTVYARLDAPPRTGGAVSAGNDLLEPALSVYSGLVRYRDAIDGIGAERVGMSGSGSSFFAAFRDPLRAEEVAASLRSAFPEASVFVCAATSEGHRIIEEEA